MLGSVQDAEDALMMPPLPAWFSGRAAIGRFLSGRMFATSWRLAPVGANAQLAVACYQGDPATGRFRLSAVNVLSVRGGRISELAGFIDPALQRFFDRAADTLLLGAKAYRGFKGFWPAMADDPDAPAVHQEIGRLENAMDKVVVSDTVTEDETDPWRSTTRIVRRADAHRRVAELKDGPGREILVFSSRTLWNDLLAHGLVDELHLMLGPAVLGGGTPLFGTRPPGPLRLADTRRFDGSDNLLLRYEVGRGTG